MVRGLGARRLCRAAVAISSCEATPLIDTLRYPRVQVVLAVRRCWALVLAPMLMVVYDGACEVPRPGFPWRFWPSHLLYICVSPLKTIGTDRSDIVKGLRVGA